MKRRNELKIKQQLRFPPMSPHERGSPIFHSFFFLIQYSFLLVSLISIEIKMMNLHRPVLIVSEEQF